MLEYRLFKVERVCSICVLKFISLNSSDLNIKSHKDHEALRHALIICWSSQNFAKYSPFCAWDRRAFVSKGLQSILSRFYHPNYVLQRLVFSFVKNKILMSKSRWFSWRNKLYAAKYLSKLESVFCTKHQLEFSENHWR